MTIKVESRYTSLLSAERLSMEEKANSIKYWFGMADSAEYCWKVAAFHRVQRMMSGMKATDMIAAKDTAPLAFLMDNSVPFSPGMSVEERTLRAKLDILMDFIYQDRDHFDRSRRVIDGLNAKLGFDRLVNAVARGHYPVYARHLNDEFNTEDLNLDNSALDREPKTIPESLVGLELFTAGQIIDLLGLKGNQIETFNTMIGDGTIKIRARREPKSAMPPVEHEAIAWENVTGYDGIVKAAEQVYKKFGDSASQSRRELAAGLQKVRDRVEELGLNKTIATRMLDAVLENHTEEAALQVLADLAHMQEHNAEKRAAAQDRSERS